MESQKSIIIMNLNVSEAIIKCCMIDEFNECGGYLFGNKEYKNGLLYFYVTKLYFEKNIKGTNNEFMFPLLYEVRAQNYAKNNNVELLGCFHSHAQYPSAFSDIDRNVLEPHWADNKLCMIFSPKYFTLNTETIFKDKTIEKPQVLIKDGRNYLTFEKFYSTNDMLEKYL